MTPSLIVSSPAGPTNLRLLLPSKWPDRRRGAVMPRSRHSVLLSSTWVCSRTGPMMRALVEPLGPMSSTVSVAANWVGWLIICLTVS